MLKPFHLMLNYTKLARKPEQFLRFTGVTVTQFDFLYNSIRKQYKTTEKKRLSKQDRVRGIGAGKSLGYFSVSFFMLLGVVRFVFVYPGITTDTLIPNRSTSNLKEFENPSNAHFDAPYTLTIGNDTTPEYDVMLIIEPFF